MPQRVPPRPLSIDDLGLAHWIDSGRGSQNGYGWKDFDLFCSDEIRMPVTVLARLFKKSQNTIKDWQRRRKELAN